MAAENKVVDYSKPTEIPYQASYSVNLTGYVDKPVRLMTFPNGKVWGAATISQIPFLPSDTRIPVIFEGDMACIAACHLKQNDHVRLGGQLMADSATQGNANVWVTFSLPNILLRVSIKILCYA
ncbi:hypothetical protein LWI29_032921 [Acer saccharum]|uniref:Uncharacterized protein n=1 Tax=Acer saccharum TaxID=4024 RepID=A0AA39SFL8_ACESA|nr:hypothetical protein LWI29_032921 [Acer saccharum]